MDAAHDFGTAVLWPTYKLLEGLGRTLVHCIEYHLPRFCATKNASLINAKMQSKLTMRNRIAASVRCLENRNDERADAAVQRIISIFKASIKWPGLVLAR